MSFDAVKSRFRSIRLRQPPDIHWADVASYMREVSQVAGSTVIAVGMVSTAAIAGGFIGLDITLRRLPDVRLLAHYTPVETTYVYDINGKLLSSLHDEANREVVTLDEISPHLKRAVLAMEDDRFYQHEGVSPNGIVRALLRNVQNQETVEGASTLTMQLAKNLFLTPRQTLSRKVAEAVLAVRMEQVYGKDKILELYLNQVYWGHNTYGVETAAQSYFKKSAADLTLAESALMAGLIQAPEEYSPFVSPDLAATGQRLALRRMRILGWISEAEERAALAEPLRFGEVTSFSRSKSPYVTDAVTQELVRHFGQGTLLKGGMRVQATVDHNLQEIAEGVVQSSAFDLYQRGYYADQMALISIDPRTHFVKAVVGGVDYQKSQFNRALQARRQPGSSFKPFVYYTALATGQYTPYTTVDDTEVSYPDGGGTYTPRNYEGEFWGPITLRTALIHSRNIPAIRLMHDLGVEQVIQTARSLGLKGEMEPVLPLALGAVEVSPIEMASAFSAFASQGWYAEPTFIAQVTDSQGEVLLDNIPEPRLVLDPRATIELTSILQGVLEEGSGVEARLPDRPAAGKTGTTDDARDVWFVGYVPQLTTAIWVGNDDNYPIGDGAAAGDVAAPIWRRYMMEALQGVPVEYFAPMDAPINGVSPGQGMPGTFPNGVSPPNAYPQTGNQPAGNQPAGQSTGSQPAFSPSNATGMPQTQPGTQPNAPYSVPNNQTIQPGVQQPTGTNNSAAGLSEMKQEPF